jgi:hypothetical protein
MHDVASEMPSSGEVEVFKRLELGFQWMLNCILNSRIAHEVEHGGLNCTE